MPPTPIWTTAQPAELRALTKGGIFSSTTMDAATSLRVVALILRDMHVYDATGEGASGANDMGRQYKYINWNICIISISTTLTFTYY